MQCYLGTYTGDGVDDRPITGVGFQPNLVICKGRAATLSVWRCSGHVGDQTSYFSDTLLDVANHIQSLDADGFTIGFSAEVNFAGRVYDFQAFRIAGAADIAVGSYTGNGTNPRTINVGFQPTIVWLKQNGANTGRWRIAHNAASECMRFDVTGDTNVITGFTATGFTVTNAGSVNAVANTYTWAAFANAAGFIAEGAYTGDGLDDRSISGLGMLPDLVWVKRNAAVSAVPHPSTRVGDVTSYFDATGSLANAIQAFQADGFQIGTHSTVNAVAAVYRYAAWKVGTSAPASVVVMRRTHCPIGMRVGTRQEQVAC